MNSLGWLWVDERPSDRSLVLCRIYMFCCHYCLSTWVVIKSQGLSKIMFRFVVDFDF